MRKRLTASASSTSGSITVTNPTGLYENTDYNGATRLSCHNWNTTNYLYIRGFDFSSIPADAIIDSYRIRIKCYQKDNTIPTQYLVNGTSEINGTAEIPVSTVNIPVIYDFVCNLDFNVIRRMNLGIRFALKPTNYKETTVTIAGCEVEVNYHVGGEMKVKQNGEWKNAVPYKKENGVWVEQSDYSNIFTLGEWIKKGD